MDDRKRQPEPSQETSPTVFARPQRRDDRPRPDRAPPQFAPGSQLGKYRIVKHLGAGGMGAVYEAVHTEIGKEVALKVLSRELATDPRAQARFLREALAASRLDHPHVVNVTDYATEGDVAYLVMELLRGEDLGAYLDRHPQGLFAEEAVDTLLAVCAGVFAAHQLGVVHRDIKPRNIFLARNHMREVEPTVLDFGISKVDDGLTDQALTDSGVIVGTLQYVSPEHVRGAPTDARSDQYALGVVLYECLTGRLPHEGKTSYALLQNIAEGRFAPPSAIRSGIPAELEKRVLRAMSSEPADRFETVHALGQALLEFASAKRRMMWSEYFGRPGASQPSGPPTRTSPIAMPAGPAKASAEASPRGVQSVARETQRPSQPPRATPVAETVYRETPSSVRTERRGRGWTFVVVLLLFAAAGVGWVFLRDKGLPEWASGSSVTPPVREVEPKVMPPATELPKTAAPTNVIKPAATATPAATAPTATSAPAATSALAAAPPLKSETPTVEAPVPSPPVRTAKRAPDPIPAARATVSVQITSRPSGAAVSLDNDESTVGRTPTTLTLPRSERPRVVWLRLPRHRPVARTITLDRDQSLPFELPRLAKRGPKSVPAEELTPEGRYQKLEE